jgi:hypothetical protein
MKERWWYLVGLESNFVKMLQANRNNIQFLFPPEEKPKENKGISKVHTEWVIAASPGDAFRKVAVKLGVLNEYEKMKKDKSLNSVFKYAKKIKKAPISNKIKIGKKEWRPVFYSDDGVAVHTKTKSGDEAIVYYVKDMSGNVIPSRLSSINVYRLRDPLQLELSKKEQKICYKNAYLYLIQLPKQRNEIEKQRERQKERRR